MVNLTKIAKSCGREVNDWIRLESTKEVIRLWEEEKGDPRKVRDVIQGGSYFGKTITKA